MGLRRAILPKGRLKRTIDLASAGARSAAGVVLEGSRDALMERVTETLGAMRGLGTKAGQIVASLEGLVPEEAREVARKLASLQTGAATSDPDEIRAVVEADLGRRIDQVFADFDPEPFASASIGQVHGARLLGGAEVAVKVQHPGVERALVGDLANAAMVERTLGRLAPEVGSREVLAEVRARILEELDQRLEADRQEAVRAAFAGDELVRVPEVHREACGRRVLTADRVRGRTLAEAAALPEAVRSRHATALWRLYHGAPFRTGFWCADPHPGNLVLHDDGTVTFLDFGCVQPATPRMLADLRAVHAAAFRGDEAAFADAVRALTGLADPWGEAFARVFREVYGPEFTEIARLDDAAISALGARIAAIKAEALTPRGWIPQPSVAGLHLPPWLPMVNRVGVTVLVDVARLGAPFSAREALGAL